MLPDRTSNLKLSLKKPLIKPSEETNAAAAAPPLLAKRGEVISEPPKVERKLNRRGGFYRDRRKGSRAEDMSPEQESCTEVTDTATDRCDDGRDEPTCEGATASSPTRENVPHVYESIADGILEFSDNGEARAKASRELVPSTVGSQGSISSLPTSKMKLKGAPPSSAPPPPPRPHRLSRNPLPLPGVTPQLPAPASTGGTRSRLSATKPVEDTSSPGEEGQQHERSTRLPSIPERNVRMQRVDLAPGEEPLPSNWEARIDSHGRIFYIDHVNRTTTWLRPSVTSTSQNAQRNSHQIQRQQLDRRYQSIRRTITSRRVPDSSEDMQSCSSFQNLVPPSSIAPAPPTSSAPSSVATLAPPTTYAPSPPTTTSASSLTIPAVTITSQHVTPSASETPSANCSNNATPPTSEGRPPILCI